MCDGKNDWGDCPCQTESELDGDDIVEILKDLQLFDFASGHRDKEFVEEVNKQITKLYAQNQKQMIELIKKETK